MGRGGCVHKEESASATCLLTTQGIVDDLESVATPEEEWCNASEEDWSHSRNYQAGKRNISYTFLSEDKKILNKTTDY